MKSFFSLNQGFFILLYKFMTFEVLFFELPVISIVCISVVPITIYIIPIPVVLIFVLAMILSVIFGVFIVPMSIVGIVVIVVNMIVFVSGIKLSILDFLKITWRKRLKKDINFLLLWFWLRVTLYHRLWYLISIMAYFFILTKYCSSI